MSLDEITARSRQLGTFRSTRSRRANLLAWLADIAACVLAFGLIAFLVVAV